MQKSSQVKNEKLITISLDLNHPLLILKKILPWKMITTVIEESLHRSPQGRKQDLDHHIHVLILNMYLGETYRGLSEDLRSNIYAREFCSMGLDDKPYDHTAYLKFNNKISPSVFEEINFMIVRSAQQMGLTKIQDLDVDSTPKEANITYPTDAKNLKTLTLMIKKSLNYFYKNGFKEIVNFALRFNFNKTLYDFRKYFFEKDKAKKSALLMAISKRVNILIENAITAFEKIDMPSIKWHELRRLNKIKKYAKIYIKQVQHFCRTGRACKDKILTFHFNNVTTIQKGKEHKKYEFGQVWQVGRLDGNFCFGMFSDNDLKYNDSATIFDFLETIYTKTDGIINTIAADRGYWSEKNIDAVESFGITEQGLHPKGRMKWRVTDLEKVEVLKNRRAGIEPIIGHLKRLGLGKSKMKTDIGTIIEGAKSFIAFNIKKLLFTFT